MCSSPPPSTIPNFPQSQEIETSQKLKLTGKGGAASLPRAPCTLQRSRHHEQRFQNLLLQRQHRPHPELRGAPGGAPDSCAGGPELGGRGLHRHQCPQRGLRARPRGLVPVQHALHELVLPGLRGVCLLREVQGQEDGG